MKLAEAILLRADIQKKIESLRERITKNTLIQDGEQPSEDPNALLREALSAIGQLKDLVLTINEANLKGQTARKRSLTAALADRDGLIQKHSLLQSAASSATKPPERYGAKEIRWVKTIDVKVLQDQADDVAKELREVNAEIQAANWQIDT